VRARCRRPMYLCDPLRCFPSRSVQTALRAAGLFPKRIGRMLQASCSGRPGLRVAVFVLVCDNGKIFLICAEPTDRLREAPLGIALRTTINWRSSEYDYHFGAAVTTAAFSTR